MPDTRANEIPQNIPRDFAERHTALILSSYKKYTGRDLLSLGSGLRSNAGPGTLARLLFWAPFVVVTSDNAADPILTYGNQTALNLWEMPWEILTKTPGRHTSEPMHRDERQRFLEKVKKNGFIDDYAGIRISKNGKRFQIERATVWNLTDENGNFHGQAATFKSWRYL